MQLLKPSWVSADGHALMSIDIHPDGTRFATGGQGTDCGRVCIWNLKPILDADAAKDKNVHKLLTQVCFLQENKKVKPKTFSNLDSRIDSNS